MTEGNWILELRRDPHPTVYEFALGVESAEDVKSAFLRKCTDHTPAHIDGYALVKVDTTQNVAAYNWVATADDRAVVEMAVGAYLTDPARPEVVHVT